MKTILAPVDFSPVSANAAEFAGNLAAFYGAELWLYHVYEIPITLTEYAFPVITVDEMQAAAEHELEQFKNTMQDKLRYPIKIQTKTEMGGLQDGLKDICNNIK